MLCISAVIKHRVTAGPCLLQRRLLSREWLGIRAGFEDVVTLQAPSHWQAWYTHLTVLHALAVLCCAGVVVSWGPPRNNACVRRYDVRIQEDVTSFVPANTTDVLPTFPDGTADASGASGAVLRYQGLPNTTYIFQVTPVGFNNATGSVATVSGSTPAAAAAAGR
jgi:hypothetical protein